MQRISILNYWLSWLLLLSLCACGHSELLPKVEQGIIDLQNWDFTQGTVDLDGDWKFAKEIDVRKDEKKENLGYLNVPGLWGSHTSFKQFLGKAVYQLNIILPLSTSSNWILKIPSIASAHELWINGILVNQQGKVGTSEETTIPLFRPEIVSFTTVEKELQIVLKVANFHYKVGGIGSSFQLGKPQHIRDLRELPLMWDLFLFGSLFMMGMYHLSIIFLRPQEKASLYFVIFCWLLGARVLFVSEHSLYVLVSDFPWRWELKIEHACLYFAISAFGKFLYDLYPNVSSKKLIFFSIPFSITLGILVLILPATIYPYFLPILHALVVIYALFFLVLFKTMIQQKQEGIIVISIGFFFVLLTAVNDILYTNRIIESEHLVHLGMLIFVFCQSLLLSKRFVSTFLNNEEMMQILQEKNEELLKMDRIKNDFLANTTHELKTPLQGMIGIAETMKEERIGKLNDLQEKNLQMILDSGKRLSTLINDVLDFSKLKHQAMVLNTKPVNLYELVQFVLTTSATLIGKKEIILENRVPTDLPRVQADEDRLQQVILNLVGNAIKFTERGSVIVSSQFVNQKTQISVKDTGIGIPETQQESIFEEFFQIDASITPEYGGTGLGLSISRQLVELHGGTLTVESVEGHGATFLFDLPLAKENIVEIAPLETNISNGILDENRLIKSEEVSLKETLLNENVVEQKGSKILVVDDEPINLQILQNLLVFREFTVICAEDGEEALEVVEMEEPDLILLDVIMPKLSGYEVCEQIRQTYGLYEIPIILLTAKNRVDDLVFGMEKGANDYLTKPFHKEELLTKIQILLTAKQAVQRLKENIRLTEEIELRKSVESELRVAQRRLIQILDSSDNAIIVVNRESLITFFNQGAELLFGFSVNEVIEQSLSLFFPDSILLLIKQYMPVVFENSTVTTKDRQSYRVSCDHRDGSSLEVELFLSSFVLQEEGFVTIIAKKRLDTSQLGQELQTKPSTSEPMFSVLEEVRSSHSKISALETALHSMLQQLGTDTPQLSPTSTAQAIVPTQEAIGREDEGNVRILVVRLMNTALSYWEFATGETKFELAENSKIWKVYIDNGTWKTRTFDKYLQLKTLPTKPRWREVIRTAHYVLKNCKDESVMRIELEKDLEKLETFLSI